MDSAILIRRIASKALRMALGSDSVYGFAANRAKMRPTADLPGAADARHILTTASARPAGGLRVLRRAWPSKPEVDVSVIVPCYNVERFVEGCLGSVISQETSRSFEVIAVDDGSDDSTGRILDWLASRDSRVRVIHQANRGFSGARNRGLAEIRGGGVAFVDSDDLLMPGAIETLCNAYDEGGCDFVTASYENMSEDGLNVTPIEGSRHHGAPWGRLYSREVWRDLEFPEGFWFEDTVQGFCIEPRWRERYVDVPVYLYRNNSKGITSTAGHSKKGLDTLWVTEEMLEWSEQLGIPFDQGMYDRVIWQFGVMLWARTLALTETERRAMFACACEALERCDPDGRFHTTRGGRWDDVERGLRERNYRLWRVAVMGLMS